MIYHAFYIEGNLLVRIENKETTSFQKIKDVAVLYNNDKVIGYNIFNFSASQINEGLVKLNKEINDEVNKRLNEINHDSLELDENNYFVVGQIVDIEKHPESDKLNICQVDVKDEKLQIVCGASNVALNQKVVVAKVGAVLLNGLWIMPNKLLKVDSCGMICSKKELGLAKESKGILVLDDTYEVGAVFVA